MEEIMLNYIDDIKQYDGLKQFNSSIERMMKRYELDKGSYEYSKWAESLFDKLQWKSDTKDIITPFWKLFSAAMVCFSEKKEYYRGRWRTENVRPTYVFVDNNIYYRTEYNKRDNEIGFPMKKSKLGGRYLEGGNVHTEYIDAVISDFNELLELAEITDSMANFAPCPDSPFNTLKGFLPEVSDFLNLMVDKIQFCFDEKLELRYVDYRGCVYAANIEQMGAWHEWFLENRERYYLQDYYDIEENKLVGRPLFSTQSLNYPLPLRTEEIHECAKNIIKIIHNRETLMNSNNRININENP